MDERTIEKIKKSRLMSCIDDLGLLDCFGARVARYGKGSEIVGYGARPAIVIITAGSATVLSEDWCGNRNIINKLGESGVYGAAFVYSSHEVTSRLVADEDCEAVIMDGEKLHSPCAKNCASHTRFLYNTLKVVSGSCVNFLEKVEHLSRRTTREKVLSYLTAQSVKRGGAEFDIPFSRQELADYLAVDRAALSAELARMKRDGLIDFRKSHFRILRRT